MSTARRAVLVFLLVLVAGCGSDGGKRRDAVNAYFDRVGSAESKLVSQSAKIDAALGSFTPGATTQAELRSLVAARATVRDALRRVRAIEPPPDAARLHADLVRLLALQASIANELVWSARFVPRLSAALRPLAGAASTLAKDLGGARSVAVGAGATPPSSARAGATAPQGDAFRAYAAAFARYRKTIGPTLTMLDRLSAPPMLAPALRVERRAVRRSVELSADIEQALLRHDAPAANEAIRALFGVAAEINGARVRNAQTAAVRAYDARLSRVAALSRKVAAERQRLIQTVG